MRTRLLLLLPVVTAARRRRLGDALDMKKLRALAGEGRVGTNILYKLDADSPLVAGADAVGAEVAKDLALLGVTAPMLGGMQIPTVWCGKISGGGISSRTAGGQPL